MNPWISGRSCEGTGTVRNDDRAKETEKAEVEDDSVVLSVSVENIKWPEKLQAYLPSSMTLDVEVGDEDSLGDAICDRIEELLDVYPQSFYYFVIDDEDDEDEDESEDEGTDGSMLDDLIEAVSRPTTHGRVFAVLGVLADHGLIPTDEETPTDEEEEDDNCECDSDCDNCPCNDENPTEGEENKVGLDNDYLQACADFFNELANIVKQSKSKDTDK